MDSSDRSTLAPEGEGVSTFGGVSEGVEDEGTFVGSAGGVEGKGALEGAERSLGGFSGPDFTPVSGTVAGAAGAEDFAGGKLEEFVEVVVANFLKTASKSFLLREVFEMKVSVSIRQRIFHRHTPSGDGS